MLTLPIKKKWFDMNLSGEKKERQIWRNYLMFIIQRLAEKNTKLDIAVLIKSKQEDCSSLKSKREKN